VSAWRILKSTRCANCLRTALSFSPPASDLPSLPVRLHAFPLLGASHPTIGLGCRLFFWQPLYRMFQILLACGDSLWQRRRLPDPFGNGFLRDEFLRGRTGFMTSSRSAGSGAGSAGRGRSVEFLIGLPTDDRPPLAPRPAAHVLQQETAARSTDAGGHAVRPRGRTRPAAASGRPVQDPGQRFR